jgi:hypothetical protein
MSYGSIYQSLCKHTGKVYIGQTQDTKTKADVPYKYGIAGRWADHIGTAFRKEASTPLSLAILEHGPDSFEVSCLESNIPENQLDEREAYWISEKNSCVPNGYNVMRHSRCKHRDASTLADHYVPTTTKVRITPVKRDGVNRLVHMYLEQNDCKSVRLVFGQAKTATFESGLAEARDFSGVFVENGIEVIEVADDPIGKYAEKIENFRDKKIEKIRIAKFNALVALYVKTSDETYRMCFGGKKIAQTEAYTTACMVKDALIEMQTGTILLEDTISKSATGGCP